MPWWSREVWGGMVLGDGFCCGHGPLEHYVHCHRCLLDDIFLKLLVLIVHLQISRHKGGGALSRYSLALIEMQPLALYPISYSFIV